MSAPEIVVTNPARRDLKRLSREVAARVIGALERYADTGLGDVAKLTGVTPPEYRLRVGDWRVRFARTADQIVVLRVLPRGEAYR